VEDPLTAEERRLLREIRRDPRRELAMVKYSFKVCEYARLDPSMCRRLFLRLYKNMREAVEAIG
jgi:hypothetical protein